MFTENFIEECAQVRSGKIEKVSWSVGLGNDFLVTECAMGGSVYCDSVTAALPHTRKESVSTLPKQIQALRCSSGCSPGTSANGFPTNRNGRVGPWP